MKILSWKAPLYATHVVLVRLLLKIFAMFELGNITRDNGARWLGVRKEILCRAIKLLTKTSALICLSSLTGLLNVMSRLCAIVVAFFWWIFPAQCCLTSPSSWFVQLTLFTTNTTKCSFVSINRAYRIRISPLFFMCKIVLTSVFQLLRRRFWNL